MRLIPAAPEKATVVIGYTIEKSDNPAITRKFLETVYAVHTEADLPATFFLLGKSIETNLADLKRFAGNPLFGFAQHTWSHVAFKDIDERRHDGTSVHLPGVPPERAREEVERTSRFIADIFGRACRGVEGARGYHLGLQDRPDLVKILLDAGLEYSVTWCRNADGWNPTPLSAQPHWYDIGQEKALLEIPNQGWQDAAWIKEYGAGSAAGYYSFCHDLLAEAKQTGKTLSFIMHDWTNREWDASFAHTLKLYETAQEAGVAITNFEAFCDQRHASFWNAA